MVILYFTTSMECSQSDACTSANWIGTTIELNILLNTMWSPMKFGKSAKIHYITARRQGRNRYRVYGQTADGRYLFVVLEHVKGTVYTTITARDMTDHEKRNFRRLRK